ncbi:hypothetical protein HNQ91_003982 [Filimonas zeae]|nr:hypothetical protein [Filimonas zeae]MDR6340909.1 hypothetical protein [Filimonas zeae]
MLSNRAYKYLSTIKRDKNYIVDDRSKVVKYMEGQGIPVFEAVVNYQMKYSGLKLGVYGKPREMFKAWLFSAKEILKNAPIDCFEVNGRHYFDFGDYEAAPVSFVLAEDGEVCIYDELRDAVNCLYSSFEKLIEGYALHDLLRRDQQYEHPYYYNLINEKAFATQTSQYFRYSRASDAYNEWVSMNGIFIQKSKWLSDSGLSFLHFYGGNQVTCEALIQKMKDEGIVD